MAFTTNLRNFGYAEGRLTADPAKFQNKDGSVKVKFTLAINDNFKKNDGTQSVQMINFEAFVPAEAKGNLGPYGLIEKGDKIGVGFGLRANNYQAANGEMVYDQILNVNSVDFKETPAQKQARKDKKMAATIAVANATATASTEPTVITATAKAAKRKKSTKPAVPVYTIPAMA